VKDGADANAKTALSVFTVAMVPRGTGKSTAVDLEGRRRKRTAEKQNQTSALIAASHDGASEIVKLLLDRARDLHLR